MKIVGSLILQTEKCEERKHLSDDKMEGSVGMRKEHAASGCSERK